MGYKLSWMQRRELIQILYDHLQDKSKVHVFKELLIIEQLDRGVKAITKDGATFVGDILVGADGVHSRTRKEMWKIADSEDASYGTERMAKCMCLYPGRESQTSSDTFQLLIAHTSASLGFQIVPRVSRKTVHSEPPTRIDPIFARRIVEETSSSLPFQKGRRMLLSL